MLRHAAQIPTALFKPPRLAEERKPFWQPLYSQAAVASAVSATYGGSGVGGLGFVNPVQSTDSGVNAVTSVLAQVHNNFIDLVGEFTGSNSQTRAQQDALRLAQINAERASAEAAYSSQFWSSATPWLIGGGVIGLGLILRAALK